MFVTLRLYFVSRSFSVISKSRLFCAPLSVVTLSWLRISGSLYCWELHIRECFLAETSNTSGSRLSMMALLTLAYSSILCCEFLVSWCAAALEVKNSVDYAFVWAKLNKKKCNWQLSYVGWLPTCSLQTVVWLGSEDWLVGSWPSHQRRVACLGENMRKTSLCLLRNWIGFARSEKGWQPFEHLPVGNYWSM